MSARSTLANEKIIENTIKHTKVCVDLLKQYVDEESEWLRTASPVDADRLSTFLSVTMSFHGVAVLLKNSLDEFRDAKRNAYRLQGISLADQRRVSLELQKEHKSFDELLKLWNPNDELERDVIHEQVAGQGTLLNLSAKRIARSQHFQDISAEKVPAMPLSSVEMAPGAVLSPTGTQPGTSALLGSDAARGDASSLFGDGTFTFAAVADGQDEEGQRHVHRADRCPVSAFLPRRECDYSAKEWQGRQAGVNRCSSISEMLRLFIGTELLLSGRPLGAAELDAFVSHHKVQTSSKNAPLWCCDFILPETVRNENFLSKELLAGARQCYVTRTKAYPRKLKSKQMAFFRAAMTLFPDETAYYCTLHRSDSNLAAEATESPFDFTDRARPLTVQLAANFSEEAAADVSWSLEQAFAWTEDVLPHRYQMTVRCGVAVSSSQSRTSVVRALLDAMMEAEAQTTRSNHTLAMWAEFVQLQPPVMNTGREMITYLFDHFFGVPDGKPSSLEEVYAQAEEGWRATVQLHCVVPLGCIVTVGSASGATKHEAWDLALREAGARNFAEVFLHIAQEPDSKTNRIAKPYAQEIVKLIS